MSITPMMPYPNKECLQLVPRNDLWTYGAKVEPESETFKSPLLLSLRVDGFLLDTWELHGASIGWSFKHKHVNIYFTSHTNHPVTLTARCNPILSETGLPPGVMCFIEDNVRFLEMTGETVGNIHKMVKIFEQRPQEFLLKQVRDNVLLSPAKS